MDVKKKVNFKLKTLDTIIPNGDVIQGKLKHLDFV
jgi:6,7-dimethyl-8-ribityllumazine synthase